MKRPVEYGDNFVVSDNEPVFTTGVIRRLLGIPVWVLKRLDKRGILSPKRKYSKIRLYSKEELNTLNHIWYLLKEKKVKLTDLKFILHLEKKIVRKK